MGLLAEECTDRASPREEVETIPDRLDSAQFLNDSALEETISAVCSKADLGDEAGG